MEQEGPLALVLCSLWLWLLRCSKGSGPGTCAAFSCGYPARNTPVLPPLQPGAGEQTARKAGLRALSKLRGQGSASWNLSRSSPLVDITPRFQ